MTEGVFLCLGFQLFVGVVGEDALVASDDGPVFLVEIEAGHLSTDGARFAQVLVIVVFVHALVAPEDFIDGVRVDCVAFTIAYGTCGFERNFAVRVSGAFHVSDDWMVGNVVAKHGLFCPFVDFDGCVDGKQGVRSAGQLNRDICQLSIGVIGLDEERMVFVHSENGCGNERAGLIRL